MNVKSTFLNGFIEEEVYVEQPQGLLILHNWILFSNLKRLCMVQNKPMSLYERFSYFLIENSFIKGKVNTTLFIKYVNNDIMIVQVYVDDIIFRSINKKFCKDFESCMKNEFEMSMMRELNYFLRLQIKQISDGIFVNQAMYTRELIKKFGLEDSKISKTLMATTTNLDKDEQGKNIDIKFYRSMIGSLLYLTISRPDIMFSVCLYVKFQSYPKESHLITVKHISRYFKGAIGIGLWYSNTGQFFITSYSDADYTGCRVDRKSMLNLSISWKLSHFVVFQ